MQAGFRKEFKDLKVTGGNSLTTWRLFQFGRVVAEGAATTKAKAERELADVLSARVGQLQANGDVKREHRKRIRRHLEGRTYATLGMLKMLMGGIVDKERLMAEAEEFELCEWEADESKTKPPLGRVGAETRGAKKMEPSRVVEQLWDSMVVLGWLVIDENENVRVMPRVGKWAREMFGEETFQ